MSSRFGTVPIVTGKESRPLSWSVSYSFLGARLANVCKDTKAVPELAYMPTAHQSSIKLCFSMIRMPLSRWPAFTEWYQIITVKQ